MPSPIDYADVQGLARFGYGGLREARFHLLTVRDAAAAREWLARAPVSTAVETRPRPRTAMQLALTAPGLRALGVPARVVEGFAPDFVAGMAADENRSRRLGDVGASAPAAWRWGGSGREPHLLVMLYAEEGLLAELERTTRDDLWARAFEELESLSTAHVDGFEPFGFRDGISQPAIDWDRTRNADAEQPEYGNLVALGELLLGYPNEYGKYTVRPLLAAADDPGGELPLAEEAPDRRDLGRNGTYLVLRQLQQDVRGFWRFADEQAGGDPAERQRLAELMVGRRMSGEPLVPPAARPIPGVPPAGPDRPTNQFTFDSDPTGARCPIGAHTRRANPRNGDFPATTRGPLRRFLRVLGFGQRDFRDDLVSSTRFHRLVRRGREYGPDAPLSAAEALQPAPAGEEERGLHFIGLNANIGRQFEFVQNAWLMGSKFAGLGGERDALLGYQPAAPGSPPTNEITLPGPNGVARRITGIPPLVTVRGGAYFFLPGLRALRYLARAGA